MKKCIVLDLDNTLWGGIVGEDGFDGIALGVKQPGAAFIAFQQALLDLAHRGVILAINSQNNYDDAMEIITKHPNMILKEKNFAAVRINWNDKVQNLREIAEELNIGLDSMVFLDDSPINRESVRTFLPQVEIPELPTDPVLYTKFLLSLNYFNSDVITDEDKMRGNLYVTERLRKEAEKAFEHKSDFLRSLGLELTVYMDNTSSLERLAQLTEKTNQFNTRKRPISLQEMELYIKDPQYGVYYGNVTDQFGNHGITAFALVHKSPKRWNIESFLLSCRIIGRGIEEAFLYAISKHAERAGVESISIESVETEKNIPAQEFVTKVFQGNVVSVETIHPPDWITIHETQ